MAEMPLHAFRPTIFSRERRFRLTADALEIDDGVATRTVPYAGIAGMRIYKQPGAGFGPTIRRTVLRLPGGETMVLQSTHYIGFAKVEDRADSYRALVAALIECVMHANPSARVTVGHSWLAWTLWLAMLVGAVAVILLGVALMFRRDFPLAALLYVGIVVAFVPTMWRVVSTSRPRDGDPRALPAGILD